MNILLIDTTSKNLIVAVVSNGQKYLACDYDCNRMHSVLLCDKISEVMILANLTLKDIDFISVNIGPGSFTGIRIGVATALGINAGVEAKLVEVNTLQMLAYTVHSECNCYVDAGNGYYYGRYNGLEEIVSPTLVDYKDIISGGIVFDTTERYVDAFISLTLDKISHNLTSLKLEPLYIRKCQAELSREGVNI